MSTPSWPEELPDSPITDGYQEQPGRTVVRSSMDAGPDKTRRRFTARVDRFQVTFRISMNQVQTLEDFIYNDIAGGADEFEFEHPRTGETFNFRIITDQEQHPYTVRNVGGDVYDVNMMLERLPG